MDVSIVIVSFNSSEVLRPCLESLHRQQFSGESEVIVVDNASTDGTPDMMRTEFPWVRLVAGTENLGYSRGVNVGIGRALGRYFFVLNPDTVVQPDSVRRMVEFMDRTPDAGIVGPKLIFQDGNTQLSCRRFYTFKVLALRRTPLGKIFRNSRAVRDHLMLDFDHESTRVVDWILGAAMMVRREAVESVGLMDERFFLYFEDVDWCYRMKQKGLAVYYCPDSVITHGYQRQSAQSVLNRSFVSHLVSLFRYYEKWNTVLYVVKRYREIAKIVLFLLLDVAAFNAAFLSAYYLRVALGDIFTNPLFPISAYGRFVLFENLLFVFTYAALGLYRIRRETRSSDEVFTIGRAIVLASILLMTSTYLGQIRTYSRLVVAFVVPFAVLYDWGLRSFVRRLHRRLLEHKVDLKRVCVVGPMIGARAAELKLAQDNSLGLDLVGVVDTAGESGKILTGALGSVEDIEKIVDKYRIQGVIVLPNALSDEQLAEFVGMGRRRVIDVTVYTDYTGLVFYQPTVSELQGRPVVMYPRNTGHALGRVAKRAFDIAAGILFVVVSSVFYVVYSLYALSRGRKPFSYSDRQGLEGAPFTIPVAGDDRPDGPSDLVNLPLYWLVLIGKLSMVGPYPLRPEDAHGLPPSARFRFDARPGVTGYWRRTGRTSYELADLLVQDANYARNASLLEDLKVLITTLGAMLAGRRRTLEITKRRGSIH
jgi:GT2 family glycosyltransferase/lipopolysaccharide/colanic/teichoic acid biosynthesis glycosyltransferase